MFPCIKSHPMKRKYIKKRKHSEKSRRKLSYSYNVYVSGKNVEVCRDQFCPYMGCTTTGGVTEMFRRWSPNKYAEQEVNAKTHINLIPKYQSYYSRSQNPPKFNIGFKVPKSDTCKTCDELTVDKEKAHSTYKNSEVRKIEFEHQAHLLRAERMKKQLQQQSQEAKVNADLHIISNPWTFSRHSQRQCFQLGEHSTNANCGHSILASTTVLKSGDTRSCGMRQLQSEVA
ncbi:hypothetical protein PR048_002131, partial [Dryococelus australis]